AAGFGSEVGILPRFIEFLAGLGDLLVILIKEVVDGRGEFHLGGHPVAGVERIGMERFRIERIRLDAARLVVTSRSPQRFILAGISGILVIRLIGIRVIGRPVTLGTLLRIALLELALLEFTLLLTTLAAASATAATTAT